MKFIAYKLVFPVGVHFGNKNLEDSEYTFSADVLFSALCQEAVKMSDEKLETLVKLCKDGKILFSDALPYIGDTYYIPKPQKSVTIKNEEEYKSIKALKSLKYIPVNYIKEYITGSSSESTDANSGSIDIICEKNKFVDGLGRAYIKTSINKYNDEKDPDPYRIGVYQYRQGSGLYIIVGYNEDDGLELVIELLEVLSYSGIGGRRSSGFGRFTFEEVKSDELENNVIKRLDISDKQSLYITLSVSLPTEEEINDVLKNAKYTLVKKGGFVDYYKSEENPKRKKDLYVLSAGASVTTKYKGDIYNVSVDDEHFVYRYAKPLLIEVNYEEQ